jgi:uncharacterized protein
MIRAFLLPQHSQFYATQPLFYVASVDDAGRPWASVLAGMPGFVAAPDDCHLQINATPVYGGNCVTLMRTL